MSIRVEVNLATCQGYGNCVLVAPDVFDIGGDGRAFVKPEHVGDELLDDVRMAAYDCPTNSILFTEAADEAPIG
jgi:ferredoxin